MRINCAEVLEYVRQLDGRSWNPVSRWTERRAPLLILHADNGLTGIGEAWSKREEIGLVLEALVAQVRTVVGCDVDDPQRIAELARHRPADGWPACAAASAIDIALWDLLAQARGEPLWKALGGTSGEVAAYASGGLYRDGATLGDLAAEIARHRVEGFVDMKIKVGGMPLATDLERIHTARAAMGEGGELWVDAVNQLDPARALEIARQFAAAGAAALQAPVAFDDTATMARINAECLPVIAAESEFDAARFEQLLATHAVGCLQFNIALCGGFSGGLTLAARAASHAIRITPQVHATAVLQAAALHFGAAASGVRSVEFHRFHDHLAHLLGDGFAAIDGRIAIGERPGLGVALPAPGLQPDSGVVRVVARI